MQNIIKLDIYKFLLIYLLLIIVLFIMKKCKINQTKLLFIASVRMTLQLILAGLVLTYIFGSESKILVSIYVLVMLGFSIKTILKRNPNINRKFKAIIAISLSISMLLVTAFFLTFVVNVSIFTPRYVIPISGMILGNAMTGISIGIKTFTDNLSTKRIQIDTLLNFGATPKKILEPQVNTALETALLPTLNSMLTIGIVSLPGMMTGQILSGTMPLTAIFYQISIMISIITVTCISVFCSLYFGSKTLYNTQNQFNFE